MSKKSRSKVPVTREAVVRTMKAVAPRSGGQIPTGSYVGKLQLAEAAKKSGKRGNGQIKEIPQRVTFDLNNRSRQLNPQHDVYWQSRGQTGRPIGCANQESVKTKD